VPANSASTVGSVTSTGSQQQQSGHQSVATAQNITNLLAGNQKGKIMILTTGSQSVGSDGRNASPTLAVLAPPSSSATSSTIQVATASISAPKILPGSGAGSQTIHNISIASTSNACLKSINLPITSAHSQAIPISSSTSSSTHGLKTYGNFPSKRFYFIFYFL